MIMLSVVVLPGFELNSSLIGWDISSWSPPGIQCAIDQMIKNLSVPITSTINSNTVNVLQCIATLSIDVVYATDLKHQLIGNMAPVMSISI